MAAHTSLKESKRYLGSIDTAQEAPWGGTSPRPRTWRRPPSGPSYGCARNSHESTHLARHFGANPPPFQVEEPSARSLFEVALENLVEGCARETYGALVAHYQALHSWDEDVRGVMSHIV